MAYATSADVGRLINNIEVPKDADYEWFLDIAEADIHAAFSGIYIAPIDLTEATASQTAVVNSILKTINAERATGKFLMSLAVVQQNEVLHAYAESLLDRSDSMLSDIKSQKLILSGAKADTDLTDDKVRPAQIRISSPDGINSELDSKSYFNKAPKYIGVTYDND